MMKVLSNTKQKISAHNNGDLVSSRRYASKKIAADCSKKKRGPKLVSKLESSNISMPSGVLRDKTNNFATNVKSSVYTPVGYQKSDNRLCSVTNPVIMPRKNLSNSFSSNQKQTKDAMKMSENCQNEAIGDVYEFILDEGEVSENKPKTKKQGKRKRVKRKIIDSPEEVLPVKKNRKPLQDKVSKNLIPESNPKTRFGSKEFNLSLAKSFSDVLHPSNKKLKTVHFNNTSSDEIIKSSSGMRMRLCTPKGSTKNISSPENVQVLSTHTESKGKGGSPNPLTPLHPSLNVKSTRSCITDINPLCSPSDSECDRLDLRMKENEISRKLLSFFSPAHITGNSGNNYSVPVTEKTPAKQVGAQSFNTDTENVGISHSENVKHSLPTDAAKQQCDKMEKNLDVSNCFGFDDDADSEDEDFSPVKTFTKSSHKLGKFQCSTPKDVGQKNGASQPFRFPALSIVKKRKFLQIAGNTPSSVKKLGEKTTCESSGSTSKIKPCISASSSVKESSKPAIFDLEEEVNESQDDDSENQQLQKKHKDCESISSPQKKVVEKSYTPRHQTRLRRPAHDEVKEVSSEDEPEEIVPKKHKKTHRQIKAKEVDEWAKCFNSMCETIDSFELVVE